MQMEKKVRSLLKMCASTFYYSGNRWLRIIQASTPLFTDVPGPLSIKEHLKINICLKVIIEMSLYVLYKKLQKK